ncbi:MAG: damage-control phosphatase, subfamily [Thermodesulfobacteriota bacterium]|nr:damage-control phosphatase, subfamily [Thermodesulfobacteriota bacterium]
MKTDLDCLPCVMRQTVEAARRATSDHACMETIVGKALPLMGNIDLGEPSPVFIGAVHRVVRDVTGSSDPYKEAREACNRKVLELYPSLKKLIVESSNPLETALRMAIAGNTIDFVVNPQADETDLGKAVQEGLDAPIPRSSFEEFAEAASRAKDILYLGDNAGEIVFDRLLVEELSTVPVTYVVRGSPVINDVTMDDARDSGMCGIAEVIDNGSDFPGTILRDCSDSFRQRFQTADMIISKGQGNYESLDDADKNIVFLFKVKCSVVARHLDQEIGTLMLLANSGDRSVQTRTGSAMTTG